MSPSEKQSLADLVSRIIGARDGAPRISPMSVAADAIDELDPSGMVKRGAPILWLGCNLYLRQVARQILGNRFTAEKNAPDQEEMFTGLQRRYPTARCADDPVYVLLDLMNRDDIAYNVERLRREGRTKLAHADALEAYGAARGTNDNAAE